MKKLSFILAAFLVCGAMQAQISFDFEDGTLQGWTTIDADSDGHNWQRQSANGMSHNNSDGMVLSYSLDPVSGDSLAPNNFLVSPRLTLTNNCFNTQCAWTYSPRWSSAMAFKYIVSFLMDLAHLTPSPFWAMDSTSFSKICWQNGSASLYSFVSIKATTWLYNTNTSSSHIFIAFLENSRAETYSPNPEQVCAKLVHKKTHRDTSRLLTKRISFASVIFCSLHKRFNFLEKTVISFSLGLLISFFVRIWLGLKLSIFIATIIIPLLPSYLSWTFLGMFIPCRISCTSSMLFVLLCIGLFLCWCCNPSILW